MLESKVKKIIGDYLGIEPKEIELKMDIVEDLNINSYDIMSIIGKFEDEFKVTVPDRDIRRLVTVEDIIKYIEKKM